MDWLKAHEYLAAWMTLPLMVVLTIIQGMRPDSRPVGVKNIVVYLAFLTCLAAVLSPLDNQARFTGESGFFVLLFYIIWNIRDDR